MMMAELAAWVKAQGKSLHEHLDDLFRQYGYHQERLVNIRMEGSDGMKRMEKLMEKFRNDPPKTLGGLDVVSIRDYSTSKRTYPCLLYTSPSPRDQRGTRMPSSA